MQPPLTPPFPAEALTLSTFGQVAPHLLLDPAAIEEETVPRVAHSEVVDPTAQYRIDRRDHRGDRLGTQASELDFELAQ